MKIRTFGIVSLGAMALTSYGVWCFTPVPEARATPGAVVSPVSLTAPEVAEPASEIFVGETLRLEARAGHPRLLAGSASESYVLAMVDAEQAGATRAPVHVAIVIDRSGSMKGARMNKAIEAAGGMIRRLRDGDTVTVISYDVSSRVDVPSTRIDDTSKERVIADLGRLRARGDTCISCALDRALTELDAVRGIRHVLLLSDGEATAGVKDVEGFRRIAARARGQGIAISSIGVDIDYNERVLSVLARDSNGRHHFVERPEQLTRAFDQELAGLVRSVARDAELVVELAEGVELDHVFDRAHRIEGRRVALPLGTFTAGDRKTALIRVRTPARTEGHQYLASVRIEYRDLKDDRAHSHGGEIATEFVSDRGRVSELDGFVSARLGRVETARVVEEANALIRKGRLAAADRKIEQKIVAIRQRSQAANRAVRVTRMGELQFDFDQQVGALNKAKKEVANVEQENRRACSCKPGDLACAMRCTSSPAPAPRRARERAVKDNVDEIVEPFSL